MSAPLAQQSCEYPGCQSLTPPYVDWPHCRSCQLPVCPTHALRGSLIEGDGEGPDFVSADTVLCLDCAGDA